MCVACGYVRLRTMYLRTMYYKGYTIQDASPTGGKAGKGHNKTTSVQVLERHGEGFVKLWHTRYKVGDMAARGRAVVRCIEWVDKHMTGEAEF